LRSRLSATSTRTAACLGVDTLALATLESSVALGDPERRRRVETLVVHWSAASRGATRTVLASWARLVADRALLVVHVDADVERGLLGGLHVRERGDGSDKGNGDGGELHGALCGGVEDLEMVNSNSNKSVLERASGRQQLDRPTGVVVDKNQVDMEDPMGGGFLLCLCQQRNETAMVVSCVQC
jgi:hypothetical protein